MRDITLGDTFQHDFTTRQFSDGVPTVLAGSPVLSVLEGNNATPITAGVSVSVSRASVAGLNEATIIATGGNGYEAGKSYSIYISTGTVGGVSVVGEVVGHFTVAAGAAAVDLANGSDGLGAIKSTVDNIENGVGIIVEDTNEIQGKLPTNKFMGSSDGADDDGTLNTISTNVSNVETDTQNIQGRLPAALASGNMKSDVLAISGDTTSADNLELMYDGTGYVDDTAPASRAQVGAIGASAGGALNFEAVEDNSGGAIDRGATAFVGVETNNYTDTDREDGTYHVIADATNSIVVVYGFNVGGGRTASEMVFKGFANANNDDLTISVWDHPGTEWETIGTLSGSASTSNITITEALLSKHTGTGTEIGKVYIRFNGGGLSAAADLNVDQILIEAVGIGQSVGYQLGAVWINTVDGVAGTENFVNGVADNPVLTLADAITIAASLNFHRFEVAPGSSITFAESHTDELWEGRDWTLALGNRDITGIFVFGATVSGTGTATGEYEFKECDLSAVTLDNDGHYEGCALEGTFTVGQAGTFTFHSCFTESASAVTIDLGAIGATAVHMFSFDGEINFKNVAAGDTVHITGAGTMTTETCTAGTIDHDGFFEYTDAGGNVTEQQSDIKVAVDVIEVDTESLNDTKIPNTLSLANINTEVVDVMRTDTNAELAQGIPTATPTFEEAIMLIYMALRNKLTVDATDKKIHNDAGTVISKKSLTDNGTVYTEAEMISGA